MAATRSRSLSEGAGARTGKEVGDEMGKGGEAGESEGAVWALRVTEEGYGLELFLGGVALRTVCASCALRLLPCGGRVWTFWIVVVGFGSYWHTAWQWPGC